MLPIGDATRLNQLCNAKFELPEPKRVFRFNLTARIAMFALRYRKKIDRTSARPYPPPDRCDVSTTFSAMASQCSVLVDTADPLLGAVAGAVVKDEVLRIEAKFSRDRPSVVTTLNENAGEEMEVDAETADLIDYSVLCYQLSQGRFDITAGALRRAWKLGGAGASPTQDQVRQALKYVGWHRVTWNRPFLRLGAGMEIDFGGIGKEYAVDRALSQASQCTEDPVLVNLGGNLRVSGPRRDGRPWRVAVENGDSPGADAAILEVSRGAVATSGGARHHVKDGTRYGPVLDSTTGWPIAGAPRSVRVQADTCSEAGQLAKLALLHGVGAEEFLKAEQVRAWCAR
jgi:thiamine biosynthesis lipoprotein